MVLKKCSLVLLIIVTVFVSFGTGKIRMVENGYESVVVSVDWDIQENLALFEKLEGILRSASSVLFRATKNRLYFREFIFVIPREWKTQSFYGNALDIDLERADVIIDNPNVVAGHTPYTLRLGGCGTEGQYIHLTPDYLLEEKVQKKYGPPGKTFVHEWGHLRWGLFDEYPQKKSEEFYPYNGKWLPTRCSEEIEGILKNTVTGKYCEFDFKTGLPEKNCKFVPFQNSEAVSSIMSYQYLDNIVEFCDDSDSTPKSHRHNLLAPNLHNKLCEYQSAWQVMRQHADFKNMTYTSPLPENTNTTPTFRYVQARPRKRVLVLDTSGSMSGEPLHLLRQAASNFILSSVEENSQVGIVEFSSKASELSQLVTIDSQATRTRLVNKLPIYTTGSTSIGAGLELGQQVLQNGGQSSGGSIILITDGEENEAPLINHVKQGLINNGIVVQAIAFGQQADTRIAQLAKDTGGKVFFFNGKKNSTALIDAFAAMKTTANGLSIKDAPVSILTDAITINSNAPLNGSFYIDSTIGKDTTLTFSYSEPIDVEIQSPDGVYASKNVTLHESIKVLTVVLVGDADPGLWTYNLTTSPFSSDVKINIESKPRHLNGEVLGTRSWVSQHDDVTFAANMTFDVYAEVTRGKTPVLGASVVATVERPSLGPLTLKLCDNGIGSDIIEDDGLYSSSIIAKDLTANGRYNIKIHVKGDKQNTRIFVRSQETLNGASGDETTGTDEGLRTVPLEPFQRVATAGEFRIIGYVPITVDQLPPARITDLSLISSDFKAMEAILEWTAVGGDGDRGQAAHYIMYTSNHQKVIFGDIQSAGDAVTRLYLNSSAPAGQREKLVVPISNTVGGNYYSSNSNDGVKNRTYTLYLSVTAVDEEGNEGRQSNIVTLSHAAELTVDRDGEKPVDLNNTSTVPSEKPDDSNNTSTVPSEKPDDSKSNSGIYLAIGISVGCVALTVVISVLVVIMLKKKWKNKDNYVA